MRFSGGTGSGSLNRDLERVLWTVQAQLLIIFGPIRRSMVFAQHPETKRYLRDGLIPRTHQLYFTLGRLGALLPPGRPRRLVALETAEFNVLLNAYYVNLVGAMDSIAFASSYEFRLLATQLDQENFRSVGLFNDGYQRDLARIVPALHVAIQPYRDWHRQLRLRRDPAAHRVPLRLSDPVLSAEDTLRLSHLMRDHAVARRHGDGEAEDNILHEIASLGTYSLSFSDSVGPGDALDPIYPTILDDASNYARLCTDAMEAFATRVNPTTTE